MQNVSIKKNNKTIVAVKRRDIQLNLPIVTTLGVSGLVIVQRLVSSRRLSFKYNNKCQEK